MMTYRKLFVVLTVTHLTFCAGFAAAQQVRNGTSSTRGLCGMCACSPENVAPETVNCSCLKTKLLIFREQDVALMTSVRELTLAGCGLVSLPPSGLSRLTALTRVTVRDMKQFHYTSGMFPALESLSVEDVGELVIDGFGTANRTLRHLTLRRSKVLRLVKGTVTQGAPLRRVLFDRVIVEEIETGALDMAFDNQGDNGQAAADGFTIVDSTIKLVQTGGIVLRTGAVRILNSTLDDLAPGALVAEDAKGGVKLSGNRFGVMVGDSVTVLRTDTSGDLIVDGNDFQTLPADLQMFKSERPVKFRDNVVDNVDLAPFLFSVGQTVQVINNRFLCDCDPRRISVLKINQVFPGLLTDADNRLAQLLADNQCRQPADTTLADYKDMLVKEIVCEGTKLTTAMSPVTLKPPSKDTNVNRGNAAIATSHAAILAAVSSLYFGVVSC